MDRVPVPEEWSGDVRDLFGRMLEKDPGRRIEMAALRVGLLGFLPSQWGGRHGRMFGWIFVLIFVW